MMSFYIAPLLFLFANSLAMQREPAIVVIKRPVIHKPEIKHYSLLSLKEQCFVYGIKMYGKDFMKQLVEQSKARALPPHDLIEQAEKFYHACVQEIDACIGRKYPSSHYFLHEPPAQPINKVMREARAKQRLDFIKILKDSYYANNKWPAITMLAGAGYLTSVGLLLELGEDINKRDLLLRTPLMCAAKNGKVEVTQFLLDHHADIKLIDACKCDARCHALKNKHTQIANLLCEYEKM